MNVLIIRDTPKGRRAFAISPATAAELVKEGTAYKHKNGIYFECKKKQMQPDMHSMTYQTKEDEAPIKKRGRPRKQIKDNST